MVTGISHVTVAYRLYASAIDFVLKGIPIITHSANLSFIVTLANRAILNIAFPVMTAYIGLGI